MRYRSVVAAFVLAGCGVDGSAPPGSQREALRDLDSIEHDFLVLLNDYRRENFVAPVMADRALNQGARDYSQLMGETNHFDHTGPDGSSFDERMCDAGYEPACGPRTFVAENIAAGQETALEVFEAWRGSPGHNANMLDDRAVVVGIGRAVVPSSEFGVYWTNTFGGQTTEHTVPNDPPGAGMDAGSGTETDGGTGTGDGGIGRGRARRRDRAGCAVTRGGVGGGPVLLPLALLALVLRRRRGSREGGRLAGG